MSQQSADLNLARTSVPLAPAPLRVLMLMWYAILSLRGIKHVRGLMMRAWRHLYCGHNLYTSYDRQSRQMPSSTQLSISSSAPVVAVSSSSVPKPISAATAPLVLLDKDSRLLWLAYAVDVLVARSLGRSTMWGWTVHDIIQHHSPTLVAIGLIELYNRFTIATDGDIDKYHAHVTNIPPGGAGQLAPVLVSVTHIYSALPCVLLFWV